MEDDMLVGAGQSVVASSSDRQQDLIWVIDDHEDSLLLISFILDDLCEGQVVGFGSGQAVLEQVNPLQPSLVLLDILLPDMNGMEVMQRLRKDPLLQQVPIVAVTALARPEDRDRLLQAGFTDYISKPYLLDDIATVLGRYLKRKISSD
jgi:two-component system, cell cycle response regulator DivK